jgi:hypothetical protein
MITLLQKMITLIKLDHLDHLRGVSDHLRRDACTDVRPQIFVSEEPGTPSWRESRREKDAMVGTSDPTPIDPEEERQELATELRMIGRRLIVLADRLSDPRRQSVEVFDPAAFLRRLQQSEGWTLVRAGPDLVRLAPTGPSSSDWRILPREVRELVAEHKAELKAFILALEGSPIADTRPDPPGR